MLHRTVADHLEGLLDELSSVLAAPAGDPMAPELIAAPTSGLHRWLRISLSRRLGASPGGADGVAANIEVVFPDRIRRRVLAAGLPDEDADPWGVDRLVWSVLEVLHDGPDDPALRPLVALPEGVTWYGRARRIADLFDRYGTHRPAMVRQWFAGRDDDGAGAALPDHARWQPRLWRLVRERIGMPSPAERMPDLVRDLRAGQLDIDLPERLSLFGVTTLPGGGPFLELLNALGTQRDVHVFSLELSPGLAKQVRDVVGRAGTLEVLRSADPTADLECHPLLRSWARPSREATVLWAAAEVDGLAPPATVAQADRPEPATLLARLQHDLRRGTRSEPDLVLAPGDRSVQIHSCHGSSRQVEVLRDAILHLLAADPGLREDDIVVLCPALDTFAPLVEAVFGPSVDEPSETSATTRSAEIGPPRLSYRISDRSLRDTHAVLGSMAALVELIGGRMPASAVIDLVTQRPVRERFGFSDDDVASIAGWVRAAGVRWGLDGDHRHRMAGLPVELDVGTWRTALQRILLGVAISEDDEALSIGEVLPVSVEGTDISVAGRFGDLLDRLAALAAAAVEPKPIDAWCSLLRAAADDLLAAPVGAAWQLSALHAQLSDVVEQATDADGAPCDVPLALADVRRLLDHRLTGGSRRAEFFRGGITVTSLAPLRDIPFRVVCLLGMDERSFSVSGTNGDDLVAAAPHLGDGDVRAEHRHSLLEAVLAAGDHLVITRTGHNVTTNQAVPPSVALAELCDALLDIVHPDERTRVTDALTVVHPRQPFDERCFDAGAGLTDGPWSFDPVALDAAAGRAAEPRPGLVFLTERLPVEPMTVIDLADLHEVLADPVTAFLRRSLRVRLPRASGTAPTEELPTSLAGLDRWAVAERLLATALTDASPEAWQRRELARGELPPGALGQRVVHELLHDVELLTDRARALGHRGTDPVPVLIDVQLDEHTRVVGSVLDHGCDRPGPLRTTYSEHKHKHRLAAWLDLMALTGHDPAQPWCSATINRVKPRDARTRPKPPHVERLVIDAEGADKRHAVALDALAIAVDCYRRALAEPIPLFPTLSPKLHLRVAEGSDWRVGRYSSGDLQVPAIHLVYGHLTFNELLQLPALDHDPPGDSAFRAARYATHLWGMVGRSAIDLGEVNDEEPTP